MYYKLLLGGVSLRNTTSKTFDMDIHKVNEWENRTTGKLIITEESQLFVRHADLFLKNFETTKIQLRKLYNFP